MEYYFAKNSVKQQNKIKLTFNLKLFSSADSTDAAALRPSSAAVGARADGGADAASSTHSLTASDAQQIISCGHDLLRRPVLCRITLCSVELPAEGQRLGAKRSRRLQRLRRRDTGRDCHFCTVRSPLQPRPHRSATHPSATTSRRSPRETPRRSKWDVSGLPPQAKSIAVAATKKSGARRRVRGSQERERERGGGGGGSEKRQRAKSARRGQFRERGAPDFHVAGTTQLPQSRILSQREASRHLGAAR